MVLEKDEEERGGDLSRQVRGCMSVIGGRKAVWK